MWQWAIGNRAIGNRESAIGGNLERDSVVNG